MTVFGVRRDNAAHALANRHICCSVQEFCEQTDESDKLKRAFWIILGYLVRARIARPRRRHGHDQALKKANATTRRRFWINNKAAMHF
jgi:hypothetical protein